MCTWDSFVGKQIVMGSITPAQLVGCALRIDCGIALQNLL